MPLWAHCTLKAWRLTLHEGQFTGANSALGQPLTEQGYRCGGAPSDLNRCDSSFWFAKNEMQYLTGGPGVSVQLWEEARKWSLYVENKKQEIKTFLDLQKSRWQWSQVTGRKSSVLHEERLQCVPTSILPGFWNVQLGFRCASSPTP